MSKLLIALIGLTITVAPAYAEALYGSDAGCAGHEYGEVYEGPLIAVSDTAFIMDEMVCRLPASANFDGKPFALLCQQDDPTAGQITITLQKSGDSLIVSELDQPLRRCD